MGLVLADSTLERFLILNYYDVDDFPKYHKLNESRAKELMSLLLYLGVSTPKWCATRGLRKPLPPLTSFIRNRVRSTYIVPYAASSPIYDVCLPLATLDTLPTNLPDLAPAPSSPPEIKPPIVHLSPVAGQERVPVGIKFASFARIERLLTETFGGLPELGGGANGRRERRPQVTQAGSTMCEECGKEVETLLRCAWTLVTSSSRPTGLTVSTLQAPRASSPSSAAPRARRRGGHTTNSSASLSSRSWQK